MDNNKEKVKLNDDLLDNVAGGYGMQGAVCPCGETDTSQFSIGSCIAEPAAGISHTVGIKLLSGGFIMSSIKGIKEIKGAGRPHMHITVLIKQPLMKLASQLKTIVKIITQKV